MPITSPDYDFLPDDTHHALAAIGYRHHPIIRGADPAMEPQREEMSRKIQQLFTERGDGRGAMAIDDSHRLAVVVGQSAGLLDAYENFPGHGDVIPYREDHAHLMELAQRLFRDWGQERGEGEIDEESGRMMQAAQEREEVAQRMRKEKKNESKEPAKTTVYSSIKFNPLTPQRGRSLFAGIGSKKGTLSGRLFHWLGQRTMPETYAEIIPFPTKPETTAPAAPSQEEKPATKKEKTEKKTEGGEEAGEEKKKKAA
ncbi:MAG: hypothetical protein PHO92_02240 [Candidatus Peribacteraceae bacterium]|nr:hypothetical protein [Candidatus Peribacteraceae bacterium]